MSDESNGYPGPQTAYFCEVVYENELDYIGGSIYVSLEELLEYRPFCAKCEIVEVDIVPKRRLQGFKEGDRIYWRDKETKEIVFVTDVPKNEE